jgi:ABC-2 type transport system permease protein
MNNWSILVRREFWEYRSLWVAPLWAAAFLLAGMVLALTGAQHVHVGDSNLNVVGGTLQGSVMGTGALLFLVSSTATGSYLLDCLYAERRDHSILFWKSLPVSDERTVLVKFAVAMLIVPAGVYAAALVTHLLGALLLLGFHGNLSFIAENWTIAGWFDAQGRLLAMLLVTLLWYAPLAAYLMLGSVYSRRAPMLNVILPPLVLSLGERLVFGSGHVAAFFYRRLAPITDVEAGLASPQLWLGLVATVVLLLVAIRLRRYRDDT